MTATYAQTRKALDDILKQDTHTVKEFWKSGFNPLDQTLNTQSPAFKSMCKFLGCSLTNTLPKREVIIPHKPQSFIGMSERAKDILFPKATEIGLMLLYPRIIKQQYGGVVVNNHNMGNIVDALMELRKSYKKKAKAGDMEYDILQCKAKALMCVIFSVISLVCVHDDLVDARDEVPYGGVLALGDLFRRLVVKGYTPFYGDTDCLFIAEAEDEGLRQVLATYTEDVGILAVAEPMHNLIVNRVKRYSHTGRHGSVIQGYRIFQHEKTIGRHDNRRTLDVRQEVIDEMSGKFNKMYDER